MLSFLEFAHGDFLDRLGELAKRKAITVRQRIPTQLPTARTVAPTVYVRIPCSQRHQWDSLSRLQPALASKMADMGTAPDEKLLAVVNEEKARRQEKAKEEAKVRAARRAAAIAAREAACAAAAAPAAAALRYALNESTYKLPDLERVLVRLEEFERLGGGGRAVASGPSTMAPPMAAPMAPPMAPPRVDATATSLEGVGAASPPAATPPVAPQQAVASPPVVSPLDGLVAAPASPLAAPRRAPPPPAASATKALSPPASTTKPPSPSPPPASTAKPARAPLSSRRPAAAPAPPGAPPASIGGGKASSSVWHAFGGSSADGGIGRRNSSGGATCRTSKPLEHADAAIFVHFIPPPLRAEGKREMPWIVHTCTGGPNACREARRVSFHSLTGFTTYETAPPEVAEGLACSCHIANHHLRGYGTVRWEGDHAIVDDVASGGGAGNIDGRAYLAQARQLRASEERLTAQLRALQASERAARASLKEALDARPRGGGVGHHGTSCVECARGEDVAC